MNEDGEPRNSEEPLAEEAAESGEEHSKAPPATYFRNDYVLVLAISLAIYGLFLVLSFLAGFHSLDSILSQLQTVTFFAVLYVMLALALNLQWGYAGMPNLAVAGFMAIGVYTMALLTRSPDAPIPGLGLPLPVGILGGFILATVLGAVAALPALRMRADYLAIVTLAFAEIVRLAVRSRAMAEFSIGGWSIGPVTVPEADLGTGGTSGISMPADPVQILIFDDVRAREPSVIGEPIFALGEVFGVRSTVVESWVYIIMLVTITVLFYLLLVRVGNSPFGRVLKAIRDDELVASSLGKDTRQFKIKAFALGCGLMGLVAMFWYLERGRVQPGGFEPEITFFVFVALILGGSGSNTGSVIGGILFGSLLWRGPPFLQRIVDNFVDRGSRPDTIFEAFSSPDQFVDYFFADVNISALRFVVLGIILVYLMQRRPEGLLGHRITVASPIDLNQRTGSGDRS